MKYVFYFVINLVYTTAQVRHMDEICLYFVINLVYTTAQVRHMDEICLLLCDQFSLYYSTGETHG